MRPPWSYTWSIAKDRGRGNDVGEDWAVLRSFHNPIDVRKWPLLFHSMLTRDPPGQNWSHHQKALPAIQDSGPAILHKYFSYKGADDRNKLRRRL